MAATTNPLVRISAVGCSFGDVQALDSVSLDIAEGEFFALLGPSGCGKTTLLRSIAGFEFPDTGSITLDGEELLGVPAHRRPVNMMFQSYALFPHMSVAKNVGYGLARAGVPRAEAAQRVAEALETVSLGGYAKRRPHQLSGGQRQRVALARAIVNRPRLLLLDEPLSALDKQVRGEMQLELKRLQHEVGIAFVVVTHDQEEALSLADRVAVLANGRVQQVAAPHELYRRPANRFVAEFVGSSNFFPADGGDLLVRPEEIQLVAPGAGRLDGEVIDVQFTGGGSTIAVAVAGRDRPVLATTQGFARVARGERVGIAWNEAAAVVVP